MEIIFGQIDQSGPYRRLFKLFGLTLTKFLKQFHARRQEISTGIKKWRLFFYMFYLLY